MDYQIILSSQTPVATPGNPVEFAVKIVDKKTKEPLSGVNVSWTLTPENSSAKLKDISGITSSNGVLANKVTSDEKLALTVTATLADNKTTASLDVGFSSASLSAPRIPQAKNGILDEKTVNGNIQAMVLRHNDDPEVGDDYRFFWGSSTLDQIDDGTNDTFPWVINIKKAFTPEDVLSDGHYTIFYTVTDINGNATYSQPLDITVTGGTYTNPIYDAPQFPTLINNTINYDSIVGTNEINVVVGYPQESEEAEIFVDDIITLYMKVYDKNYQNEIISTKAVASHTVTENDLTNGISFILPKNEVSDDRETFDDVRGQFWYTVEGMGSVAVSGSSNTKSTIIDTVSPN